MFYIYMKLWDFKVPQKRKKRNDWFLLHFFLFFLLFRSRYRTLWGDCLPRRGSIRNRWTGWWPPSRRPEQRRNCHSKSQRVDVCECRFVSEDDRGLCYVSEGATANVVPVIWVTDTPSNICSTEKNFLSFLTLASPLTISLTLCLSPPSLSPPRTHTHTQELDDLFILQ